MTLKIVKATEPMPVANLVVTIYGAPGLGKTSLASTADKPLLLDFDKGAYRASNRPDVVTVQKWADVEGLSAEDLEAYSTIVLDTAGRALDIMGIDIIEKNPKMGRPSGALSLQGFGELKGRFARWQTFIRSLGKDVILVCHMEEQKQGDDILERIDAQGASKNEIYKSSDAMCRIQVEPNGGRVLNFDPREGGFGKNPAQLPRLNFPHPDKNPRFLADVLTQIKASINKQTEVQAEAVKETLTWEQAMAEAATLEDFNKLVPLVKERGGKEGGKGIVNMLGTEAKKRGYHANKITGLYEQKQETAVA